MPQGSSVTQLLKTFSTEVDRTLHAGLLSTDEVEEIGPALLDIQARLNTYKNTLAPINKLPPEVLGRIFEFAVAPEPDVLEDVYELPPSTPPRQAALGWYEDLILVCTRWNTTAMRCPRMWYHVVDDDMADSAPITLRRCCNPRVVLRRSGQVTPLHLYMAVPPQPGFESIPQWVIDNQPLRVEALHLTVRDDARKGNDDLLQSLATPLPSLRLLTVDAKHDSFDMTGGRDMPIILGGETSGLEALIWSLGVLFLPGNAFPNLAHLSLYEEGGGSVDHVRNLDRLLQLLSNCPRLETLVFAQGALNVTSGMGAARGPVALNHLCALWIRGQYLSIGLALIFLFCLELPEDATVRLSNLCDFDWDGLTELEELPAVPVPFLARMDGPIRLDIIHCAGGYDDDGDAFHFIVVGSRSRFWLHMPANRTIVLRHLSLLYTILPKKGIETVRVSVPSMRHLAFLSLILSEPLPSLSTLLIRHSRVASPSTARAGINALARALYPDRDPADDTSGEPSHSSDSEGSSDDLTDEGEDDSDSGWESADDSDEGDPPAADQSPFGDDDPSQSPAAAAANLHNISSHTSSGSPVEPSASETMPAPRLKVVGLELKCEGTSRASLKPFVRAIAERKRRGHPLATVQWDVTGVERGFEDVEDVKEHIVDGVTDVGGRLWVPTIDEGWMAKNDYWRLYPTAQGNDIDYPGWGLDMEEW